MKSIEIENIKNFTTQLFAGTTFDHFLVTEASFSMAFDYTIDGHLHEDFFGEEEKDLPDVQEGITCWSRIKPVAFAMIKGKKVPRQFKIVFKMPAAFVQEFLTREALSVDPEEVTGLFLNVFFKNGQLNCTTGISKTAFSLDRSLEEEWDTYMVEYLKQF